MTEQVLLKSGYAFVDFPDQNSAIKAIETLSGKCVDLISDAAADGEFFPASRTEGTHVSEM